MKRKVINSVSADRFSLTDPPPVRLRGRCRP